MPIDLKKIPEKAELPVPPDKRRWFITIVLCIVSGAILVLSFWRGNESTHTVWFWFCSLFIPFLVGFMGYIFQLRRYENERDRIIWWNHLHQQQYDEQVALGRLAMGMLATAYITPDARNKLATALLQEKSELQPYFFPQYRRVLTTALISPQLTDVNEVGYLLRMEKLLTDIIRQLQPELEKFLGNFHIRILHDGTLKNETINTVWHRVCSLSFDDQNLTICTESDGIMWIDNYLDCQEEILILSIEINLFLEPRDQQAESVSAILLASPAWLTQHHVTPQSWIHRPVVMDGPVESVTTVTLWGNITTEVPWFFWRSQIQSETLTLALQSMEQCGYMLSKKGDFVLDDTFGRLNSVVGNVILICANEHAVKSNVAQWLLINNKTTHMLIVHPV